MEIGVNDLIKIITEQVHRQITATWAYHDDKN